MSRIIIKNLPKKVTEEQLVNHFSKNGAAAVTDAQLKYKKNGDFRGFGFLGFETDEGAKHACEQFHNTFIKQNKIVVELCMPNNSNFRSKGSEKLNGRTEEPNTGKSDEQQSHNFHEALKKKEQMTKERLKELMKNHDFIQYLKLNQKGTTDLVSYLKKKYSLINGEIKEDDVDTMQEENEDEHGGKLSDQQISDVEYLRRLIKSSGEEIPAGDSKKNNQNTKKKNWQELFTVVIRGIEKGKPFKKKAIKDFLNPVKHKSLRIPKALKVVAYVGFKTQKEVNQVLMKNGSFIDGVRVRVYEHKSRKNEAEERNSWKAAEERLSKTAEPVTETGKLFVRNLWYSVTEEELRELFEQVGPVVDLTLPVSRETLKPKGFAHITYMFPADAVKALNDLDGTSFKGRILHILPSTAQDKDGGADSENKNFRERKKESDKKKATSWHNWNSLFLGTSAVMDAMAENYGTSKRKILENESEQSSAVNTALQETLLVEKTKQFLETEGVCIEAFTNPNVQRSSTVILAKNLPLKTVARELSEIFGKYGSLGRVILPPSGITAVIEFLDPGEAKQAFRDLAYSRFKSLPLFLEWAPLLVFKSAVDKTEPASDSTTIRKEKESIEKLQISKATIFVKNLSTKTDEDSLRQHFSSIGEVECVLISKQRGVSRGFGFVQFSKSSSAKKALKQLQNSSLDESEIELKFSEKKLESDNVSARKSVAVGKATIAKIIVRNIPFQASEQEIRQLFQTFGELKSIRLPKKLRSSEHRGFGFIEFVDLEQAKQAMESLRLSTHLYGRRLALEWAQEDESVDDVRKRTAEHFLASETSKKQKIEAAQLNEDPVDSDDE